MEWAAEIETQLRTLEKNRDVTALCAAADLTAQRIEAGFRDRSGKARGT